MKRLISMALVAVLMLSMVACGEVKDPVDTTDTNGVVDVNPGTSDTTDTTEVTDPGNTESGDTIGSQYKAEFTKVTMENMDAAGIDYANKLVEANLVPYMMGAMPLSDMAVPDEEGKVYLQGFDNCDFSKYDLSNSAIFMPMMGSVPFIGYVFVMEDQVKANEFVTVLKDNANMRWQVCVEADEMVAEVNDNRILFMMCPSQIEEQPAMDELG